MSRRLSVVLGLTVALLGAPTAAHAADDTELIVRRDAGLTAAERADVRADAGVRYERAVRLADTEVVSVPAGDADRALRDLRADPDVRWAMRNDGVRATAVAGKDPLWEDLWGLDNTGQTLNSGWIAGGLANADMDIPEAWRSASGSGVTVAVADTGVMFSHPDLQGQLATNPGETGGDAQGHDKRSNGVDDDGDGKVDDWQGWDFVNNDNVPADDHWHGTHVTGIIAAANGNGVGISGVAPDARVLPLKVLDRSGRGTWDALANAFDLAGDLGIRVVNASLAGTVAAPVVSDVIAQHPGTLYVVAAGNDNLNLDTGAVSFPCEAPQPNVLCVGASDASDRRAGFSDYGSTAVDLYAPGVNVYSTYTNGGYAYADGTSMAAPNAAGVAALLLASQPALTAGGLKAALMDSAEPKAGLVSVSGGRVNARLALAALNVDRDADGVPDYADDCRSSAGPASNHGCPPDRDQDGVLDGSDACPDAPGPGTGDGCPVPAAPPAGTPPAPPAAGRADTPPAPPRVLAIKTTSRGRTVTVRVTTSRPATVRVTAQREACRHGRCTWKPQSGARAARAGTVKLRLSAGRYRLRVVAGNGPARYKTITVRR
jgi:subtilisin family serine protease